MIRNFKIFENNENYKIIASNESYWSWEYDSDTVTARILLFDDNSLYLTITKVHSKSGLGAGTTKNELVNINIGNLQKADLALVRSLLKKHAHTRTSASGGFSKLWEDEEGNKLSLTDLINLYKEERDIKSNTLKHIKQISNFQNTPTLNIELVKYSDRAYALFGDDTKKIKDQLINLGCRYNKFLTDPSTGNKRAGWICSLGKVDKIKEIINDK
jgi:hypothetical protein